MPSLKNEQSELITNLGQTALRLAKSIVERVVEVATAEGAVRIFATKAASSATTAVIRVAAAVAAV